MGVHWEKVMGGGGGGSCFVFWKVTELLRDTSIRNVNTVLTFSVSVFPRGEKERKELKMNYKAA